MQKTLAIKVDEKVYEGLYSMVGRGQISQFIEELIRPHIFIQAAYRQMAHDEVRESEALEWSEALIGDVSNEPR
ncbi:MAG: addiction module antitoxin [Candidatus Omnitrophica bacterium]|nr:addiction module antitoxin [Patescibacteria group bacterium]MBU1727054.1 addiction module antitoxin [Candidatus Omnitrophota bacterium]MBU1935454.1 addiction module antitoxin [Patescibacteria group bacterium]